MTPKMVTLSDVPHGPKACKKCRRKWYAAPGIYRFGGWEPTTTGLLRVTFTPSERWAEA